MPSPAVPRPEFYEETCPTPGCGRTIRFPASATQIVCPGCNEKFSVDDEAPQAPPPPPPPPVVVRPREAPRAPVAAVPPPPSAPPPPPPPPVPQAAPAPVDETLEEDEPDVPLGAGDAATPEEARRRGGRQRLVLAARPPGVTDFIFRSREFQWSAKGGLGCPYGPLSFSAVIWDTLYEAGELGIDEVDLAVKVRERMVALALDYRSILQRIVMVCERVCTHPHVGLMERCTPEGQPDPNGVHFRLAAKHRLLIPLPPDDMVGVKRRRVLESARAANAAMSVS